MEKTIGHCCALMAELLDEGSVPIEYDPRIRRYSLDLRKSKSEVQVVFHCPWCGVLLPSRLNQEYIDTLQKDYGIDVDDPKQEHLIPKEFKTDEWWKKREL